VTKIFADHHNATLTTNDFALVADLLHAWINLHAISPLFNNFFLLEANQLLVTVNDSTFCKVIWTEFNNHTIGRQNTNVVLSHLATDMCQNFMSIC